ncbi:hypothetical protein GOODEAATRI_012242, partial [Goodea atripinnis]
EEGGPSQCAPLYIHIIHIAPNEEELAGSSRGCQSKHQLQIVSERSAWKTSGPGASVGAQLLIRSHPADSAARKKEREEAEILEWFALTAHLCMSVAVEV